MRFIFKSNLKNRKEKLNVDVENCGNFKGFGFMYILVANPCDAQENC